MGSSEDINNSFSIVGEEKIGFSLLLMEAFGMRRGGGPAKSETKRCELEATAGGGEKYFQSGVVVL